MKRPSFQFYPGDWQRDNGLRAVSLEARGLWIEILCVMHQADPYGHLVLNGAPIEPRVLARMIGGTEKEVASGLAELEAAGVCSRENGVLVSRRMIRDEQIRAARAAGGALGAEHGAKGAKDGAKGGRPRNERGDGKPPLPAPINPPPSSSSSSSEHLPTSSGAAAPPLPGIPEAEPDPIFGTGLDFLVRKGASERTARSFLGGLRKKLGDVDLLALLVEAEKQDITEPVAWLAAAANTRLANPRRPVAATARAPGDMYGDGRRIL